MQPLRNGIIAGLDIGSSQVSCFIARFDPGRAGHDPQPRILGVGHHESRGVKSGAIVNMADAERSIRAAVDMAERMARETVRKVIVNLSCGQPASHLAGTEITIPTPEVRDQDVKKVLRQSQMRVHDVEGELIHAIPVGYSLDGHKGIADPRGMFGDRLGVCLHFVTASAGPIRNLALCVERCHLEIAALVATPYASGLACLVEDETEHGVTCIDMGGGLTSIAVFVGGNMAHLDVLAVGGSHVTNDIALGLSTSHATAERIKALYGSATVSASDERDLIDVPRLGEEHFETANHVPRSILNGIIQPRIEEILELARDRLAASGLLEIAGRRIVLTGGGSQLAGVRDLAAEILQGQIRLGRPIRLRGLPDASQGPEYSTVAGLIGFAMNGPVEAGDVMGAAAGAMPPAGRVARIGQWLRENF
ncbi:MAG TPA: cell division protein FtsA [Alphaproteobacteria bacterium]|jgi:cell division protein FtsA|nr:cell division protein FtsA [Alphaproteobacteria bacterium]